MKRRLIGSTRSNFHYYATISTLQCRDDHLRLMKITPTAMMPPSPCFSVCMVISGWWAKLRFWPNDTSSGLIRSENLVYRVSKWDVRTEHSRPELRISPAPSEYTLAYGLLLRPIPSFPGLWLLESSIRVAPYCFNKKTDIIASCKIFKMYIFY